MAKEIETVEIIALKKIRMDNESEGVGIRAYLYYISISMCLGFVVIWLKRAIFGL